MLCNRCEKTEWVGPKFSRIPAPYPDHDNAGHYLALSKTPRTINGKARAIDDLAGFAKSRPMARDGPAARRPGGPKAPRSTQFSK